MKAETLIYIDMRNRTMGMGQLKSYWEKAGWKKPGSFNTLTLKFPWVDLKSFVDVFMDSFYKIKEENLIYKKGILVFYLIDAQIFNGLIHKSIYRFVILVFLSSTLIQKTLAHIRMETSTRYSSSSVVDVLCKKIL